MECEEGFRISKRGVCIKRCPRGTRKKQGVCIPREKKLYCPKGFRKGPGDKCIRKKCPKGTHIKNGECISPIECSYGYTKNKLGKCIRDLNATNIELKETMDRIRENPDVEKKLIDALKKYEKNVFVFSRDYSLP